MDYQELFQKTVDLKKEGKLDASRNLVLDYLSKEPESIDALHLLTDLLINPADKKAVLDQILKINPNNRAAQDKIKKIQLETATNNAYGLAKEGKLDEALSIVDRVIIEDNKMASAWYLKAKYSKTSIEVEDALEELKNLADSNKDAQLYYKQLTSTGSPPKETKRKIRTGYLFIIAAIVILLGGICGILATPLILGGQEPTPSNFVFNDLIETITVDTGTQETMLSCQEIIERAILLAKDVCTGIESNQACYGNQTLFADFVPNFSGDFEDVGDLVALDQLTKIVASPLQVEEQLWGIAYLKLQAIVEGTIEGQNVTFIVFGDTAIENSSRNMSTFYFTSGLTGITCERVDYDGLFVEMPDGSGISFTSNGIDVVLQGNAILQAQPSGEMSVAMLSGSSELSSNGQSVIVNAGNYSTIPMGENLEPVGPISEPKPLTHELLEIACQLIGVGCPGNPIPTLTPTSTATLTPTQFFQIATSTPRPPTSTSPPPPTNTVSTGSCSDIKLAYTGTPGQYRITNNYSSDIVVTSLRLAWPVSENGSWNKTTMNGPAIHARKYNSSPATAELFADTAKRTVPIGNSAVLNLIFAKSPAPSGYNLTVGFNVGCLRSTSN